MCRCFLGDRLVCHGCGAHQFFLLRSAPTDGVPSSLPRHDSFVAFGLRAAESHNIAVGRYVIMPDHVHLFVCGDLHFHLGKWIKALRQALGKSISSGMRHDRIWQEGFFDHILRSDESMAQKWEYVRDNPVRAGFVRIWTEWPFQGEIVLIDRACL